MLKHYFLAWSVPFLMWIKSWFQCKNVDSTFSTLKIIMVSMQELQLSCWNHDLLGRSLKYFSIRKKYFSRKDCISYVKALFSCLKTTYSTVNKIVVSMQELRFLCWNHDLFRRSLEILGRRKYLFLCEN